MTIRENVLLTAVLLALLLAMYGVMWVSLMLGSLLYGAAALFVIAALWVGAILTRNHMKRQRIVRHGTPGRVRVIRVEDGSLAVANDWPYCVLTVEVLAGGPQRTITISETYHFMEIPEIGDELDVLFDTRSPDLAIIRPD